MSLEGCIKKTNILSSKNGNKERKEKKKRKLGGESLKKSGGFSGAKRTEEAKSCS